MNDKCSDKYFDKLVELMETSYQTLNEQNLITINLHNEIQNIKEEFTEMKDKITETTNILKSFKKSWDRVYSAILSTIVGTLLLGFFSAIVYLVAIIK